MSQLPLPPGQQLAAPGKWPPVGERAPTPAAAALPPQDWTITIHGLVERPCVWKLADLWPRGATHTVDIHCVTRWSMLGATFTGVLLSSLLEHAGILPAAQYVSFVSASQRRHSTSLTRTDALSLGVVVAWAFQDQPLTSEHGGPVRTITPSRYFYKSVKWLTEIELLAEDRLGYWEGTAGYHNGADPWREQRFIASGICRSEAAAILASRDLTGRDLLGFDGSGRSAAGLQARRALLRNANFERADLRGGDFQSANLSNASFRQADLREADFRGADLEGADLRGADLRGANLTGASLFGTLFVSPSPDGLPDARMDDTTRLDQDAWTELTPRQAAFLAASHPRGRQDS